MLVKTSRWIKESTALKPPVEGAVRPASEQQVLGIFNTIARRYDLLNRLLSVGLDQRWRRAMVNWLPEVSSCDGVLLDVATGTGDVIFAAHRYRKDYQAFKGFDLSENMLQVARQKSYKVADPLQVEWTAGSAERLPYQDDSADALTIAFGLRNVINKENALSEFTRVLKPQASLLILELMPAEKSLLNKLFLSYFEIILPKIGSLISNREAYEYLPKSVNGFYSFSQLNQIARQRGLLFKRRRSFAFGTCQLLEFVKK